MTYVFDVASNVITSLTIFRKTQLVSSKFKERKYE
jgi:hypothetical protein